MHFFQLNHLPFNVHYTFGNYISLQSSPNKKKKKKLESSKKNFNVHFQGGETCDHPPSCFINNVYTTSTKGMLRAERRSWQIISIACFRQVGPISSPSKPGAFLICFPFYIESKHSAVLSEEIFLKSILHRISNRQSYSSHPRECFPGTAMGPALPFYLHSGQLPKSFPALFDLMPETWYPTPTQKTFS